MNTEKLRQYIKLNIKLIIILFLAAALAVLVVIACVRVPSKGSLTLWCEKGTFPASYLTELSKRCRSESGINLVIEQFGSEDELGEAFETSRPDLLFCSSFKASDLGERAGLSTVGPAPVAFSGDITAASPLSGSSFFPVGASVTVVVGDSALVPERFESLETFFDLASLYYEENGKAFFAADSCSDILYSALACRGTELYADEKRDARQSGYTEQYNLLAQVYYDRGAVIPDAPAADYAAAGQLPCAVVRSDSMNEMKLDGLSVQLLPSPQGGEELYAARLMGFAVLSDETRISTVSAFLTWLFSGNRAAELAAASGLVPVYGEAEGSDALGAALTQDTTRDRLFFIPDNSSYLRNEAALEVRLRAALDLFR